MCAAHKRCGTVRTQDAGDNSALHSVDPERGLDKGVVELQEHKKVFTKYGCETTSTTHLQERGTLMRANVHLQ